MKFFSTLAIVVIAFGPAGFTPARAESPAAAYRSSAPAPASPASTSSEASAEGRRWKKRWIATWLAVAAVNVLDVHSSQGHREANPLLRDAGGRFSTGKAILLKAAIGGGLFAAEWWAIRRHPNQNYYRPFTVLNSMAVGGLAGVVAHNYSLPPPKAASGAAPAGLADGPSDSPVASSAARALR